MIYVFGDCEIDPDLRELRRAGTAHAVEPQVFDLLLYLIENRERMVTKDDLFEAIWSGRIVSEANLSNRINLARQAIGDSGKKQAFIRTVPRRGFRFVGDIEVRELDEARGATTHAATSQASEHPTQSSKPSIAVMPFENLSGDPEQEYFSDGIAGDIITALSRVRQFYVIARNSTFAYKGRSVDVRAVAEDLGVRYILEGNVRKSGERVRISAELIDGKTGNQLWAEQYDRDLEDIFAVQDEIKLTVVGALQPELARSEVERARNKPPDNLDAWDLYQRGLWNHFRLDKEGIAAAIELYLKSIEADSDFASPHAALAECYVFDAVYGNATWDPEAIFAPARKAVAIDSLDASAHRALGAAHFFDRNPRAAIAEFNTALQLSPSDAHARFWLGASQVYSGLAEDALENFGLATSLSPRDPFVSQFQGGMAHALLHLQRYEASLECSRRAMQYPNVPWPARAFYLWVLVQLDLKSEADRALADLLTYQPDLTISVVKRMPFTDEAYHNRLIEGLRKAGLPEN